MLATVLFVVILQTGRDGPFGHDLFGGFYDGQGRALLDGHLDVDPDVPGIEGFRIGEKTHIYQGIAPALARLPLLWATDRLDGQLTGLSMLIGFVVKNAAVVAAAWRLRRLVRGDAELGGAEWAATAAVVFAIGAGTPLFLAGQAWVYHEALMWGVALCLVSLTCLLYWMTPRAGGGTRPPVVGAALVGSVVAAGLALNTRSSIGLGPFAALGIVGLLLLLAAVASRRSGPASEDGADVDRASEDGGIVTRVHTGAARLVGWSPEASTRSPLAAAATLAAIALAFVVLYGGINHARFGSWFSVPLDKQVLVAADPIRSEALDANGGTLFGVGYLPSVLVQAVRPDAVGLRGQFPFLTFPERPAEIGDAVFAELDWSSSLPTSVPLLFFSGLLGLAVLCAPRRLVPEVDGEGDVGGATVTAARLVVLGAAVSGAAVLVFGYIAQRYLTDMYPLVVLGGLVGLHTIAAHLDRPGRRRSVIAMVLAGIVVAALWTAWINSALALQYGREIAPGRATTERAEWLLTQSRLGTGFDVTLIGPDEPLPEPAGAVGAIVVAGDCAGLYRSNGTRWYVVETGEGAGFEATLERTGALVGPVEIAATSTTDDGERAALVLEPLGGDQARLVIEVDRGGTVERSLIGPTFALIEGQPLDADIVLDARTGLAEVRLDDADGTSVDALRVEIPLPAAPFELVGDDVVEVTGSTRPTPACDRVRSG